MKIQTSRESHHADKRYAGVYQQQGRMITDADWNELMEIVTERRRESLGDVVQSGVPRKDGLKIVLDSDGLGIVAGHIYAGGMLARLPGNARIAFTAQGDLPDVPAPTGSSYQLYADVWDRTLTSLEDDGVRDTALHGADTCARTQTMVQVKWCVGVDLGAAGVNPPCGDAPLTLTLRKGQTLTDPCDPCAAEETGDQPALVGNYLFRVEVHEALRDAEGNVTELTLKWSSENGAEHYRLSDGVPDAYTGNDWVFELFNEDTERHLGVHHVTGQNFPQRGQLSIGYPPDVTGYTCVRRWDGFVVLKHAGGSWEVAEGKAADRGFALSEDNLSTYDGWVDLNGSFTVNLKSIKLTLGLDGHTFVAGDYWTAAVREAVDKIDDLLLDGQQPSGIVHHYLILGKVTTNGAGTKIADPETDAEKRRLNFPSLTTLMAKDVGLENNCDKLYGTAENVQDALNNLCDIEAKDVAYDPTIKEARWNDITDITNPPHPIVVPNTVQDALDTLVENLESSDIGYHLPPCTAAEGAPPVFKDLIKDLFDESGKTDVKELWDELLCHLDATRIPYDPRPQEGHWKDVIEDTSTDPSTAPHTVQDALDTLVGNLESSDIGYELPECKAGEGAPPLFKDLLGLPDKETDVKKLWDAVLCRLSAATVPVDKEPPLLPPLDVPTVKSVQDALNVLAGRGKGGGLASVLEELANAVGIMPDDSRRRALTEAPVSGDQSLAESTYGMVVDILRIFAAFALEFIDLQGVTDTPDGILQIGTSASVNLRGTLWPDARAFAIDQIKDRQGLWPDLSAKLKDVVWCELAEFLVNKNVDPNAVKEMGRRYGGETGYNGPAARRAFLEDVYKPLFHPAATDPNRVDLDHTTLATFRALLLEFLARLWKRIATDLYIHEPPSITPCPDNMRWLQAEDVQRVLRRIREPDGLLRIHAAVSGPVPPAPRIATERLGGGGTWVIRDDSLERYRNAGVVEAFADLSLGKPCPDPSVVLQFGAGFQVRHAAGALYKGQAGLEILYTEPGSDIPQVLLVDVDHLPAAGEVVPAPGQAPAHQKGPLQPDGRMVLGDGFHASVAHYTRQTTVSTTGAVSQDLFVPLEGGFSLLQSRSDGTVLADYNLTIDRADAGPTHLLVVESKAGRQRLMLANAAERPWWKNRLLTLLAHTALHPGVAVVGVAHDQIILQIAQPTGSDEEAKWAFLPFRTLAEALWGDDRDILESFWHTRHPDGNVLFESLDGSVTSTAPSVIGVIRERPETPLFPLDRPVIDARLVGRAVPLPLNPGVVRRAAPAGRNGWLTVLAEDEILGLYQSYRENQILPVLARRYHVRHARSVLGSVIENGIVLSDVTESALQFEFGSIPKG